MKNTINTLALAIVMAMTLNAQNNANTATTTAVPNCIDLANARIDADTDVQKDAIDATAKAKKANLGLHGGTQVESLKKAIDADVLAQKARVDAAVTVRKANLDLNGCGAATPATIIIPRHTGAGIGSGVGVSTHGGGYNPGGEVDPIFQSFLLGIGENCGIDYKAVVSQLRSPVKGTSAAAAKTIKECMIKGVVEDVFNDDRFTTMKNAVETTGSALQAMQGAFNASARPAGLDENRVRTIAREEISPVAQYGQETRGMLGEVASQTAEMARQVRVISSTKMKKGLLSEGVAQQSVPIEQRLRELSEAAKKQ